MSDSSFIGLSHPQKPVFGRRGLGTRKKESAGDDGKGIVRLCGADRFAKQRQYFPLQLL